MCRGQIITNHRIEKTMEAFSFGLCCGILLLILHLNKGSGITILVTNQTSVSGFRGEGMRVWCGVHRREDLRLGSWFRVYTLLNGNCK